MGNAGLEVLFPDLRLGSAPSWVAPDRSLSLPGRRVPVMNGNDEMVGLQGRGLVIML